MVDWTYLNGVDWVIVVVLALSVLISLWRGFAREALSLVGWVVAFLVANLFVSQLASVLDGLINNLTGRYVASYVILFVAALMACSFLAIVVSKLIRVTGLSVLDRLLGTVFGLARGLIIILVTVFVVRALLPPRDIQWLAQSQFMPHLDLLSQWAQTMFAKFNAGQLNGIST